MTERKTPVTPSGSGTFHRDQSRNSTRQLQETLRECPKCDGKGEIRTSKETNTGYAITIESCAFCEGVGCVPKWKIA